MTGFKATLIGGLMMTAGAAMASAPVTSIRPESRAAIVERVTAQPVVFVVGTSVRPTIRPARNATVTQGASVVTQEQISTSNIGFQRWIDGFRQRAMAQGITGATLDKAFRNARYNADAISRDRNQSEFTKTLWDYLDSAVSDSRIGNGKAALREHAAKLDRIEAKYGVEKEVVVAVWGLESAYGAVRGKTEVIPAMATLAYDGRRGAFFEEQLIAALKILQNGDTNVQGMTGSWAGAMGHTQFMPTSYLDYAQDFNGDGRRDIWSDDPTDALASTANYLKRFGWVKGMPWGVEVQLPQGFDYALADRKITKMPNQWGRLGVRGLDGKAVPNHGSASILLPAGSQGVALMIFKNFSVIERYNAADAYVIGVGHLSDRIVGKRGFQATWPRGDRALKSAERKELQQRLTRAGFSTQGVDGRIGPNTIAAIRSYQKARGLTPDGYPSLTLLQKLR
ncbi:MAG: lytic murein transglycosylase [Pseudomonadota bacterium]